MSRGSVATWCCLLALAPGCSLAYPYPDFAAEQGETACHDGFDNDSDGLIDCADDGCTRCVARPRVTCPAGWTSRDLAGDPALGLRTCEPPDDVLDGCLSEAPAGALVARAEPGAVLAALQTIHDPIPDPEAPAIDVWLEPGRHVVGDSETQHALLIGVHVAFRGLCRDGAHAVLAPAPGNESPIVGVAGVDLDHVELELAAGLLPPNWEAALVFSHSLLTTPDASEVWLLGHDLAITIDHSRLDVPLRLTHSRVHATDSLIAGIAGTDTEVSLARVGVHGTIGLVGLSPLTAEQLFVACGGIAVSQGASAVIGNAAISAPPGTLAVGASGRAGFRSHVALTDATLVTDSSCASAIPIPDVQYGTADVEMERVWIAEATGLELGLRSVATLTDTTVVAMGVPAGIRVTGATCTATRTRVLGALRAGVEGTADPRAATLASFTELYVDGVGPAVGCDTTVAGLAVHAAPVATASDPMPIALRLSGGSIRDVRGCGVFAEVGVDVEISGTEVATSDVALCATSRPDASALLASIVPAGDAREVDPAIACAGLACSSTLGCAEHQCANGVDDDGDGAIDCADTADCGSTTECGRVPENCANSIDDDHDGAIDCADSDCASDPSCGSPSENCHNGVDDDHDGAIDCADADCVLDALCSSDERGHCADAIDQDGDGAIDCADTDCIGDPSCPESGHCSDGIDNDGFGGADCADSFACSCDPSCGGSDPCPSMNLLSAVGPSVASGTMDTAACSTQRVSCAPEATGGALTFAWDPPTTGLYSFDAIDTSGMGFDPIIAVRAVACDGPEIACDHHGFPTFASSVTVPVRVGQPIIVVLRSRGASVGQHYTLNITAM